MRQVMFYLLLGILLLAIIPSYAQFDNPNIGFGFAAGGAAGDNSNADKWVVQYRGYLQYKIISPVLLGQLGVGYTKLNAPSVYETETVTADIRFLLVPFSLEKLNPFLYGGFGVAKDIAETGSDYLPMVPMGAGIQTRLGSQMLLELSGGYNLVMSDKLDGRQRTSANYNSLTNKKHDGYFGFLIGLLFTGTSGADSDADHDGLTKKVEKELGTDPKNADTDGDALNDGAEVNSYNTYPLKTDSDADGLSDGVEVKKYKTDPLNEDSDEDGLSDGDEVNKYKTYPLKKDSDADGLSDGDEVKKYKTDPLNEDSDADGLNDGDEVKYKSKPLKEDSDGDGINDGVEVNQYKSDPAKADTDGDGLSDGDEVNKYKTSPIKIDTDGGSVADGAEITNKTNPLDSQDDIKKPMIKLEKGKKVVLKGVNFESNKATLTANSASILEKAYNALVANPDVQIEISGHTDSQGSDEYNQALSLRRAQAVKNWLAQRGIAGNRMMTVGKGEMEPIANNNTKEGRAENRRIEFYVQQ